MTRLEFTDGTLGVNVEINQDRVSLEEAIATFQEFLEDAGYDLDDRAIGLVG
tara:strand:+ start:220 stop:375 length:156 start_codon:yes stop_codon:yes gene_type:complete